MIVYQPEIGSHIDAACRAACTLAEAEGLPVRFQFNDVAVIAQPGDTPENVRGLWEQGQEEKSAAYRASPEYAAEQAAQKKRAAVDQALMDRLMTSLPAAVKKGEREIVRWCRDFVPLNDWSYVSCDRVGVWSKLTRAGYLPGDCVHHPKVQTDTSVMARWIVGQVLDGLMNHGGIIHPMMARFADEYLKWQETGVLPARTRLGDR